MNLAFRIGNTIVDYRVLFDYDDRPFEFDNRSQVDFLHNATLIERRLATISDIQVYQLIADNPILWGESSFYLDMWIRFYSEPSVSWMIRLPENMTDATHAAIGTWKLAFDPIILGTMSLHREQAHEEARQAIRNRAKHQATNMRDNGDRLLRFLAEFENDGTFDNASIARPER